MSLGRLMKELKRPAGDLLVTPGIEAWLRKHEGPIMDDSGVEIMRGILERERGNTPAERAGRFGASSRGTCHRRQIFSFLGMPQARLLNPETINLFNDGKWRHLRWQIMGIQASVFTHAEWPARLPKYRVKVSMDALNANEAWIFELKGDRLPSRVMVEPDEKHMLQIQTMLLVTGWDRASYVMEDKRSQEWRERVINRDPKLIAQVRTELEILNEHVEERRLPGVLPACQKGEGPYRTCPYAAQCLERWQRDGDQWPDRAGDWDS